MKFLKKFKNLDDIVNPVAVKELRQNVQSRSVSTIIILFLCLQVLVVGWAALFSGVDLDATQAAGSQVFSFLLGILNITCLIIIPAITASRFAKERMGANVDLMYSTSLSPGKIIRGKFIAGAVLCAVIYCSCLPFMTFTYMLRGIDVLTIFMTTTYCYLCSCAMLTFAMFCGAIPAAKSIAKTTPGVFLCTLAGIASMVAVSSSSSLMVHFGFASSLLNDPEVLSGTISGLIIGFMGLVLLLLFAEALIKPSTSNVMLPIRIWIFACWAVTGILMWLWYLDTNDNDFMEGWSFSSIIILSWLIIMVVSDRHHYSIRLKRQIPKLKLFRPLAFLFYSGCAGGILWWMILIGITVLIGKIFGGLSGAPDMLLIAEYAFAYGMLGLLIKQTLFKKASHYYTWVYVLLFLVIGTIVPVFMDYIFTGAVTFERKLRWWMISNPFILFDLPRHARQSALVILSVFNIIMILFFLKMFIDQFSKFKPWRQGEELVEQKV